MLAIATTALLNSRHNTDNAAIFLAVEGGLQPAASAQAQAAPSARQQQQQYGYHNTFHQHATATTTPTTRPPVYQASDLTPRFPSTSQRDVLPGYTCTVSLRGTLGLKSELTSPFLEATPSCSIWNDVSVELIGTQLRIYKQKVSSGRMGSGNRRIKTGKLLRAYSMQHAEVGVAADFEKSEPVPRTRLAKLIPPAARQKVYETDPHLFEPVREHVIRVRLESEQFLLCAASQSEMLDWVESLAAAIDISMPLEDRSEPRYRSLPRRARRQREIEAGASTGVTPSNLEEQQSLIQQQERLFRELYPHLAAEHDIQRDREAAAAREVEGMANSRPSSRSGGNDDNDPDADDLDRSDALVPTITLNDQTLMTPPETPSLDTPEESYFDITSSRQEPAEGDTDERQRAIAELPVLTPSPSQTPSSDDASIPDSSDPKSQGRPTPQLTPASALRYRRRCAPVLLASSPRASGVIVTPILTSESKKNDRTTGHMMRRVKIDAHKQRLVHFETFPPRYDAHEFPKMFLSVPSSTTNSAARPALGREDTAVSSVSSASMVSLTPATTHADSVRTSSEGSASPVARSSSAMASRESVTPSRSHMSSPQTSSTDLITPTSTISSTTTALSTQHSQQTAKSPPMIRETSKNSLATANPSQPPSPTSSLDADAQLEGHVVKRSRRLSLHARFLGRKGDGQTERDAEGRRERRERKVQVKPVIPASEAAETQMAAYAALMF